jgi:hypothetical protein
MAFDILSIILLLMTSNVLMDNNNYDMTEDKTEWTDFGDMFSYDTNTKSNFKKSDQTSDPLVNEVIDKECDCHQNTVSNDISIDMNCDQIFDKLNVCEKELKGLNELTKPSVCNQRITIFFSRAILKLIKKLKSFDNQLSDEKSIQISTFVFANNIQIIEEFVNQNSIVCQRVDEFEDAITEVIDRLYVVHNSEQNFFSNFIQNHSLKCLVTVSIILFLLFIYKLYLMSFYSRIITVYILIFFISFLWEWIQLYQIKSSEKHLTVSSAPIECDDLQRKQSTFSSFIISYFIDMNIECKKYYRALMVDPIFEVNPLEAISSALANALFKPIGILGDQLGKGLSNFYNHFNFYTKIIITFPLTIVCVLITCLYMGYSIKFPYFLGSIVKNPEPPPLQYTNHSNNRENHGLSERLVNMIPFNRHISRENRASNDRMTRTSHSSNNYNTRVPLKRSKSMNSISKH